MSNARFDATQVSTVGVEMNNSSDLNFGNMSVEVDYGLKFFQDNYQATRGGDNRDGNFQRPNALFGAYIRKCPSLNQATSMVPSLLVWPC